MIRMGHWSCVAVVRRVRLAGVVVLVCGVVGVGAGSAVAGVARGASASSVASKCATSVNVTSGYYDEWANSDSVFADLARDGFRCVVIVPQMFAKDRYYKKLTDPQNPSHTSGDSSFSTFCNGSKVLPASYAHIKTAIGYAKSHGLAVVLKPHIDSLHSDTGLDACANLWRGLINPAGSSDQTSYKSWWSDYDRDMGEWAKLAQATHAAALVIGVEFSALTSDSRDNGEWTSLISKLRQDYDGPLGYATNWDAIKEGGTSFFSKLDFVGLDGYYPPVSSPGAAAKASVSTLADGWGSTAAPASSNCTESNFEGDHSSSLGQAQRVECAHLLYGRPVYFTEVGYESNNQTAYEPYNDFSGSAGNSLSDQQRAIDAFYEYFNRWDAVSSDPNGPRDWLDGAWWWNADIGKPVTNDKKWTLRDKPGMVALCERQNVSKSTCTAANPSTNAATRIAQIPTKAAPLSTAGFLGSFNASPQVAAPPPPGPVPPGLVWQGAFKIGGLQAPFGPDSALRFDGAGRPATATRMQPSDLAARADGSVLVAAADDDRVLLIKRDGRVAVLAGTGKAGYSGDGGPATHAQLLAPDYVAMQNDGAFAISDLVRARQVDRRGMIHTIAGGGNHPYRDGAPARSVSFIHDRLGPLIQRPDGTLVISAADQVFDVDRRGRIHTLVKLGRWYGPGPGDYLREVDAFAIDGRSLLASDQYDGSVWRLTPGSKPVRIAGNGRCNEVSGPCPPSAGDGGPATQASLPGPDGLAVLKDGSIIIAEATASAIRRVTPNGTITTLFPTPRFPNFIYPTPTEQVALATDGSILFTGYHTVNMIASPNTKRLAIGLIAHTLTAHSHQKLSLRFATTLPVRLAIDVRRRAGLHSTIRIPLLARGLIHILRFILPRFPPGAYRLTLTATTPDHQIATAYAPLLLRR